MKIKTTPAICRSKTRHRTQQTAEWALYQAMKGNPLGPLLRSYPCPVCLGWHLTKRRLP